MNDVWPLRKLRELAEVRVSSVDKKTHANERPVKLCNYMDVYSHEYITHDIQFMDASASTAEISRFNVERDDVILTKDSETPDDIGVSTVVIEDFDNLVCGYHLALLKPNKELVNSVYLSKQLSTSHAARYFALCACGSTRFGLPVSAIESILIPFPPQPEQSKIAHILSTIDRVIEQTEALIAKQQRIKSGLMQDLLTRGIDEQGNVRSEKTHHFKDSPLGRIPVEWEVKPLRMLCEIIKDGTHLPPNRVSEGPLLLSVQNMVNGKLTRTIADTRVSWNFYHQMHKNWEIQAEDVLLAIVGATIGKTCLAPANFEPYTLQRSVGVIRGKKGVLYNRYLLHYFRSPFFQLFLHRKTNSTAQAGLYLSQIADFYIPISPIEEQIAINSQLEKISNLIEYQQDAAEKLKSLKTALMQDLLTGRKRVTALLQEKEMVNA
jgi:type I restriction enzyme S subunit